MICKIHNPCIFFLLLISFWSVSVLGAPSEQELKDEKTFMEYFTVKKDEKKKKLKGMHNYLTERKSELKKKGSKIPTAEKEELKKITQEIVLIDYGFNPYKMTTEERSRAIAILIKKSKSKKNKSRKSKKKRRKAKR